MDEKNQPMTIDEMHEILNDLADELPPPFFAELTGGISLVEEIKYNPQGMRNDLYILGTYHRGGGMGRYITIYYGSMMAVYGHYPAAALKAELRKVLRHEFRHHVESLAGEKGLELEDEQRMRAYLERVRREKA